MSAVRVPDGEELALLMRCEGGYRRSRSGAVSRDLVPPTPTLPPLAAGGSSRA